MFECDSQRASLTPVTELTPWKVRTEHPCSELAKKLGESVQGPNRVDAFEMFELK